MLVSILRAINNRFESESQCDSSNLLHERIGKLIVLVKEQQKESEERLNVRIMEVTEKVVKDINEFSRIL